jgi:hypothetical protein
MSRISRGRRALFEGLQQRRQEADERKRIRA